MPSGLWSGMGGHLTNRNTEAWSVKSQEVLLSPPMCPTGLIACPGSPLPPLAHGGLQASSQGRAPLEKPTCCLAQVTHYQGPISDVTASSLPGHQRPTEAKAADSASHTKPSPRPQDRNSTLGKARLPCQAGAAHQGLACVVFTSSGQS